MTRTVWVVMALLIIGLGVGAAVQTEPKPQPAAGDRTRAPGPDRDFAQRDRAAVRHRGAGRDDPAGGAHAHTGHDRLQAEEGARRPDRADPALPRVAGRRRERGRQRAVRRVRPPGRARCIEAGRGGSIAAGAELVQSQLFVPANSEIETVVVPRCIESKREAEKTASGRAILLEPQPSRPRVALAGPC